MKRYQGLEEIAQKDVPEPDSDHGNDNASLKPVTSDAVPPTPEVKTGCATTLQEEEQSDQTEDSEDDYPNPNQEAYFTDKQPTSNHHKWLVGFYNYLLTPAVGFLQERKNEINLKGNDITFLDQDKGTRVWLEWGGTQPQKQRWQHSQVLPWQSAKIP